MATITWRGGSGNWSVVQNWSLFRQPQSGDAVLLGGSGPYTVTIDVAAAAQDIAMTTDGATLDVLNTLSLGGTLSVASGADLVVAGTILGGTIDSAAGVTAGFGTLDGTALTGVALLADITITAATATANVGTTLHIGDGVSLAAGTYDSTALQFDLTGSGGSLATTGADAVTFGAGTTIDLFEDPSQLTGPLSFQSVAFTGAGTMTNLGAIDSNDSNQLSGTLSISVASFSNLGGMDFAPLLLAQSGLFVVGIEQLAHGSIPIEGQLNWTQGYAETLTIASASFSNGGLLRVDGGTLDLTGGQFSNTGTVALGDVAGQVVTADSQGVASVVDVTLATRLEVGAATTFSNTGTVSADSIIFDGSVALAALGTLQGALTFNGTLDLGGGTLDAGQFAQVTFGGLVEDGTIGAGVVVLNGATLDNVAIVPGGLVQATGPVTLIDPPASVVSLTLDATTTEVQFSAGATSEVAVVAGATQSTDLIRVTDSGEVTFGAAFTLSDTVAGSTVELGGFGTLADFGVMTLDGATLLSATTLDGGGTILMSDSAAVTLDALAATATTTIEFGSGPSLLVLPGTGSLGVSFVGLHTGDVIDFSSISSVPDGLFGTGGALQLGGTLDVQGASGDTAVVQSAAPDGLAFSVGTDGAGGTLVVVVACFAQGTRIAAEAGEVAVECLRPGDLVRTHAGRLAPVRWVGHSRVDLARHPVPERAAPIRVRAGALADGVPRRDLLVSPEHCFLVDGALVPAFLLVNGATIARQDGLAEVIYWHVELDRHDVLLAEGAPAESYLDTGNRALFAGEAGVRTLHADLGGPPDAAALRVWAERGCAELRLDAAAARARLLARARALGWTLSGAARLAVLAGGRELATTPTGRGVQVRVAADTTSLRLLSDSFVPAEVVPGSGDLRRLGVAVSGVIVSDWELHPDALDHGWHAARGEHWRWSGGAASVALPRLRRPSVVEIRFGADGLYWQSPARIPPLPAARRPAA
jgi:hypothetical protein